MGTIYMGWIGKHTPNCLQTIEGCAQSHPCCGTDSDFQGGGDREQCGQGHDALLASDLPGRWTPSSPQDPDSQGRNCEEAIRTATVSPPAGFLRPGLTCERVSPAVWAGLSQLGAPCRQLCGQQERGSFGGGMGIFLVWGTVMSSQNTGTGKTCSLSHRQGDGRPRREIL